MGEKCKEWKWVSCGGGDRERDQKMSNSSLTYYKDWQVACVTCELVRTHVLIGREGAGQKKKTSFLTLEPGPKGRELSIEKVCTLAFDATLMGRGHTDSWRLTVRS